MKHRFLCSLLLLLAGFGANAQKPDQVISKVRYHFTHLRDTTKKDFPYVEDMVLLVGKNASVYRSLDRQIQEEAFKNQIESQFKSAADPNHVDLTIKAMPPFSTTEYFQYVNDKKLIVQERVINDYLAEEPLPAISWKIKSDTLTFGVLHCQKATTHFKGRDYEAWFCPDLPFQNGPWKLCGLPGLILEAYDTKKEVVFKFDGFENMGDAAGLIALPDNVIKTSRKDLDNLKDAQKSDPMGFSKAAHGSGVARPKSALDMIDPSKIHSINIVAGSPVSRLINNPIELPEKIRLKIPQ